MRLNRRAYLIFPPVWDCGREAAAFIDLPKGKYFNAKPRFQKLLISCKYLFFLGIFLILSYAYP